MTPSTTEWMKLGWRIQRQDATDKNKRYAPQAPDVACIDEETAR